MNRSEHTAPAPGPRIRHTPTRLGLLGSICILGGLGILGCAGSLDSLSLPPALQAEPAERLLLTAQGEGHWVYHCRLSNDGQRLAWAPFQPDAVLRDGAGREIGRLGAGPNFAHRDGSLSEATLEQRQAVDGEHLPWARYAARSAGAEGQFSRVTRIQQVRTRGGAVPAQGCQSGEDIMAERRVPFVAEFRFLAR
ncbi:MAG: DUF3455 domain-containing protein [Rubrivivax sp.]|nr:DUF3455 domain-containing protein [Rubrivivax sp.]